MLHVWTKLQLKKSRNGDTLGPVELVVWPEQGNQGDWREQDDQGEVQSRMGQVKTRVYCIDIVEFVGAGKRCEQ